MKSPKITLRVAAESLRARGLSVSDISAKLGMNLEYARKLLHERSGLVSLYDQFNPTAEDHERHVTRCMAEGGFPAVFEHVDGVAWLSHDLSPWQHIKARRAA